VDGNYIHTMKTKNKYSIDGKDDLREFIDNLEKAIRDTGVTPYAWAKKVGVDTKTIYKVLRKDSNPVLSTIIRLVKGTELSLDKLLGLNTQPQPSQYQKTLPSSMHRLVMKKEDVGFFKKLGTMHEIDLELLKSIAVLLEERRARSVAQLLSAVKNRASKKKGECMLRTIEKTSGTGTNFLPQGSDELQDDFLDDIDDYDMDAPDDDLYEEDEDDFEEEEEDDDDEDEDDYVDFDNE